MGTVDFLQGDEKKSKKSDKNQPAQYGIEYTNPDGDYSEPLKAKKEKKKFSLFGGKKNKQRMQKDNVLGVDLVKSSEEQKNKIKRVKIAKIKKKKDKKDVDDSVVESEALDVEQPVSVKASLPTANVMSKDKVIIASDTIDTTVMKNDETLKIEEKKPTIPIAPVVPPVVPVIPSPQTVIKEMPVMSVPSKKTTPDAVKTSDESLPHFAVPEKKVKIPTPPPPPVHAQPVPKKVEPKVEPSIKVPPPPAIVTPTQMPTTELPLSTAQSGRVHSKNVQAIHGKETDPELGLASNFLINLLPSDLVDEFRPISRIANLIKVAIYTVVGIGVLYGAMIAYQFFFIIQTQNNLEEISKLDQEILTYKDLQTDINESDKKIEAFNSIVTQHVYWSNFFELLEKYTLPNVHYTTFAGTVDGKITLQATTTDYASVSRQVAVLKDATDFIKSVYVTNASSTVTSSGEEANTENQDALVEELPIDELPSDDSVAVAPKSNEVLFAISAELNPDIFLYKRYEIE